MTYPPPNHAGQSVHVRRAAPVCAAVPYRATLTVARGRMRNRFVGRGKDAASYEMVKPAI